MQLTTILSTKGSAVITIHPEASIAGLVAMLAEHSVGALVVSSDGSTISGIVSERDVVRALNHGSAV
ncbi:MAG: CBS domain-containing protein, partial [Actinobacteria bacterium]|nr:CBS domain-containing protein [Actinomycetota bacterium]